MFTIAASSMMAAEQSQSFVFEDDDVKKPWTIYSLFENVSFVMVTCVSIWVIVGVAWYAGFNHWDISTAYFYTIEAGMSIGFCNPTEYSDWSKLFTTFYVIMGSTGIAGAIGEFLGLVLHPRIKLLPGDFYLPHDRVFQQTSLITFLRAVWYQIKFYAGWYTKRSLIVISTVYFTWMGLGVVYGMVVEKWSFITALYWAITTASTGGLQSPTCIYFTSNGTNCHLGDMRGFLMGVWMMFGVPIYAFALGEVASIVVNQINRLCQASGTSDTHITEKDFLFAARLLSSPDSTTLNCGEYILLKLMLAKKTSAGQILKIQAKFNHLDHKLGQENAGVLTLQDLQSINMVVKNRTRFFRKNSTSMPEDLPMDLLASEPSENSEHIEMTRIGEKEGFSSVSGGEEEESSQYEDLGFDIDAPLSPTRHTPHANIPSSPTVQDGPDGLLVNI